MRSVQAQCPTLSWLINIKAVVPRPCVVSKEPDSCCTMPHPRSHGYTKSSLVMSADDFLLLVALSVYLSNMRCALLRGFSSHSFSACISSSLHELAATGRASDTGRDKGRNKRCQNALHRQIVVAQWISISEVTVFITFGEVCQPYIHLAVLDAIYSTQTILSRPGSREHNWIKAADAHSTYFLPWNPPRLSLLLQLVWLTGASSAGKHQFWCPDVQCPPPLQLWYIPVGHMNILVPLLH